jgi:hypothetical protein
VPSSTDDQTSRHLEVVRVHAAAHGRTGAVPTSRRVWRLVVLGGSHLARGVRLLGAHFTAFAWRSETGKPEPDRGRGPRSL